MQRVKRVIAQRVLEFRQSADSRVQKISVRIRAPQRKGQDWSVVYEIRGPGKRRSKRENWGVDAVQALHMAMANVPVDIEGIEGLTGGKVTFLGGEDLRFPSFK
jgi:hypothetical protein